MITRAGRLFSTGRFAAEAVMGKIENRKHQAAVARASRHSLSPDSVAADYDALTPYSLALSFRRSVASEYPRVVLVLPALDLSSVFAGVKTALEVGLRVAQETGRPLGIIPFRGGQTEKERKALVAAVRKIADDSSTAPAISIHSVLELASMPVHEEDLWVVTHWTTAHAAQVAAAAGLLTAAQVIYLVQDYEPGFTAWSTHFAVASATYHAGFHLLVNSTPVAAYLREAEGVLVPADQVFHPQLDLTRLNASANERVVGSDVRILFYARPSKPRNMFDLGVSTLKVLSRRTPPSVKLIIVSAGERHQDISLPNGRTIQNVGKLPWDEYYRRLARTDIVFNLQMSPHPSHLPLDALASGASAVSNDLGEFRAELHRDLYVAPAEPDALATALEAAISGLKQPRRSDVTNAFDIAVLGKSLSSSVESLLGRTGSTRSDRDLPQDVRTDVYDH